MLIFYDITNVKVEKLSIFDGYQIDFYIDEEKFRFMVGYTKTPFPLNIIHCFEKDGICPICSKRIVAHPNGQQPCFSLKMKMPEILDYFKKEYPKEFKK